MLQINGNWCCQQPETHINMATQQRHTRCARKVLNLLTEICECVCVALRADSFCSAVLAQAGVR